MKRLLDMLVPRFFARGAGVVRRLSYLAEGGGSQFQGLIAAVNEQGRTFCAERVLKMPRHLWHEVLK